MGFISNERAKSLGIDMGGQDFSKHSSTDYGRHNYANEEFKIHHEYLFSGKKCPCKYCVDKKD